MILIELQINYMADRLILTGFMGSGKSKAGQAAAERLGYLFSGTDERMSADGIDVPALVEADAEKFRRLEAKALESILEDEAIRPAIISTGGGIVSTEIGRRALISSGVPVVLLDVSFDVARERVRGDTDNQRPLFDDDVLARELYESRQQFYEQTANHTIDASLPLDSVVGNIIEFARSN